MTDNLPSLSTQIVPPSQNAFPIPTTIAVQDVVHKPEAVEEEPYTIKCICNFSDDDGNTIYCETCDSWQHIECYYPDNIEDALREDFAHSCVDCKPRPLDRQQATERQRARTTMPVVKEEASDKKKRPPPKSHKKKPKPAELQLNGHAGTEHTKNVTPHDHPHPPKKSKHSHKPNPSISSQAPKRSPSYGTSRGNPGHPPSPATTPPDLPDDFEIHNYSSGFLSLNNDPGVQIVRTNSFAGVSVANKLSEWLRDPEKMKQDTGWDPSDVFQRFPENLDVAKSPVEVEHSKRVLSASTVIPWQSLRAVSNIAKDAPLMELNGQLGFQNLYCSDPENRWDSFTSPLPFVFFHPILPIYIDTRREGSEARYVRRSCRPNAVVETYLSEAREYHFWIVSDRQIAAKEQITIPWDFRFPTKNKARMLRILGLSDEEDGAQPDPNIDENEYQTIDAWVRLVLSEYGGCACNLGNECAFVRFHRHNYAKAQTRPLKKKVRKPKAPHTISPTSTGHATNSRAASEGRLEEVAEDARSVSGSSRSKPPSRDMSPAARQGSFDTLGILTEPTDRDKRKVAMVEDSFRRMEQQHQPPRKKKRTSDGTSSTKTKSSGRASVTQTPNLSRGPTERRYVDAGTSRSKSGSPASAVSPHTSAGLSRQPGSRHGSAPTVSRQASVAPRLNYCDMATQTEPEDGAWYKTRPPTPKRRILSLSQRLLENRHRCRVDGEEDKRRSLDGDSSLVPMEVDGMTEQRVSLVSPSMVKEAGYLWSSTSAGPGPGDVPMPDAPTVSPSNTQPPPGYVAMSPGKHKSPDLRVSMPRLPTFTNAIQTSAISATTPISAGGLLVQSPLSANGLPSPYLPVVNGLAVSPSPVKKKLSLSDYTKSRMNRAAGARPSIDATSLKPMTNSEDPKSASSDMGNESPTAEKAPDAGPDATTLPSTNGTV